MRAMIAATVIVATVLSTATPSPAIAAVSQLTVQQTEPVAVGVTRKFATATAANGKTAIHVVDVDVGASHLRVETSQAFDRVNGREAPTKQGRRRSRDGHRVVATINGSTFGSWPSPPYAARGLNVSNGELITAGFPRSGEKLVAFGLTGNGTPIIGMPTLSVGAKFAGGSAIPLARVNQPALANEASLYTPRFDVKTGLTDTAALELVIETQDLPLRVTGTYNGTVVEVRSGMAAASLGPNRMVISSRGTSMAAFSSVAVGDKLHIDLDIDNAWRTVTEAIGGREQLVRNNKIDIFPTGGNTYTSGEPRSALGITSSGKLLMVAADGRQTNSKGLTIPETAELMKQLGAVDAINLDGGGSTMLAARRPGDIEAQIVNSPSDGVERSVANALHVVSLTPTGSLSTLLVRPATAQLRVGDSLQFTAVGHDNAYNGVAVNQSSVNWSTSNSRASITSGGLLTAKSTGDVTVNASTSGRNASANVSVVGALSSSVLSVSRPEVAMIAGATAAKNKLPLRVSWSAGSPGASITLIELQRRVNGGSWMSVSLPSRTATALTRAFAFGRVHQLRVRATDSTGNRSAWVLGAPFRLDAYNENHSAVQRSGSWSMLSSTYVIGGWFGRSSVAGARASLTRDVTQVAVVGQRGPGHGSADVYLNDQKSASFSVYASSLQRRRVLWIGPRGTNGSLVRSKVELRNVSSGTRTRVDLDAFIVLTVSST